MAVDDKFIPEEELSATDREILGAIRYHIQNHGEKDWKLVLNKFPELSKRRFFRLLSRVRDGVPDKDILKQSVAHTRRIAKTLPAAPSPAVIAQGGIDMRNRLDVMSHLQVMLDDIDKIREFSLGAPDENGVRRIKNPAFFMQQIKQRGETLKLVLEAYGEVWDLRTMQNFYNIIMEEIGKVDPLTQRRIMVALEALNNERGLTISAQVA